MCNAQCAVCNMQCAMCNVHCAMCSVCRAKCSVCHAVGSSARRSSVQQADGSVQRVAAAGGRQCAASSAVRGADAASERQQRRTPPAWATRCSVPGAELSQQPGLAGRGHTAVAAAATLGASSTGLSINLSRDPGAPLRMGSRLPKEPSPAPEQAPMPEPGATWSPHPMPSLTLTPSELACRACAPLPALCPLPELRAEATLPVLPRLLRSPPAQGEEKASGPRAHSRAGEHRGVTLRPGTGCPGDRELAAHAHHTCEGFPQHPDLLGGSRCGRSTLRRGEVGRAHVGPPGPLVAEQRERPSGVRGPGTLGLASGWHGERRAPAPGPSAPNAGKKRTVKGFQEMPGGDTALSLVPNLPEQPAQGDREDKWLSPRSCPAGHPIPATKQGQSPAGCPSGPAQPGQGTEPCCPHAEQDGDMNH